MKAKLPQPTRIIDWARITVSLRQKFRREPEARERIPEAVQYLHRIAERAGPMTANRRALRHIGISLAARTGTLRIISPICLSIPAKIPEKAEASKLVKSHIAFLDGLGDALPVWRLECLFPPPERDEPAVAEYIEAVCRATEAYCRETDARVVCKMMVEHAPGMIALEELVIEEICGSTYLSHLCGGFVRQRTDYYTSLGIDPRLWPRKNRRTMAQYVILGRLAALEGALMCNHTTANIHCAVYAGGGVLHNPVGFML